MTQRCLGLSSRRACFSPRCSAVTWKAPRRFRVLDNYIVGEMVPLWPPQQRSMGDIAREAYELFNSTMSRHNIPARERNPNNGMSQGWHEPALLGDGAVASHARIFDVTVVGRPVSGVSTTRARTSSTSAAATARSQCGRSNHGGTVHAIDWIRDGRRDCTRAASLGLGNIRTIERDSMPAEPACPTSQSALRCSSTCFIPKRHCACSARPGVSSRRAANSRSFTGYATPQHRGVLNSAFARDQSSVATGSGRQDSGSWSHSSRCRRTTSG